MDEIDIWRTAHRLIKQHGDEAGFVAAQRAAAQLDKGDMEESSVWIRIGRAIEALRREKPNEGEAVN